MDTGFEYQGHHVFYSGCCQSYGGKKIRQNHQVASVAATEGIPKLVVYSASKGAMVAFTKAIAMELGEFGINVNCTSPGMITTENPPPESDGTFLGRKGTADEMALLIEFFASDDASFITGVDYLIDGGRTLGLKGN